jgi:hypothetical protein
LVLGSICEILDRTRYLWALGLSVILIPLVLLPAMPRLDTYGGLSGLDCTFYTLLFMLMIKIEVRDGNWCWVGIFAVMLCLWPAKVLFETAAGLTIFVSNTHPDMVPVPLAHLVGGIIGFAAGLPTRVFEKFNAVSLEIRVALSLLRGHPKAGMR